MVSLARSMAAGAVAAALLTSTALAHVSVSGKATVGTNQLLTFSVGHGCEGLDTVSIQVHIPAEIMSVRAMPGPGGFGDPVLTKNDADAVTAVTWAKTESRDADDAYYQFGIRVGVPETPFATLYFPTTQTCLNAEGEEVVVEWAAMTDAAHGEAEEEPAPSLVAMPARFPGWNKYTVEDEIHDLSIFDDALIVWSGEAAYSSNPETMALIESDEEATELTEIEADAEIWVKY